jgi:L-ascorbate metabolism protein UlaG (beta-lactamase superfamily)
LRKYGSDIDRRDFIRALTALFFLTGTAGCSQTAGTTAPSTKLTSSIPAIIPLPGTNLTSNIVTATASLSTTSTPTLSLSAMATTSTPPTTILPASTSQKSTLPSGTMPQITTSTVPQTTASSPPDSKPVVKIKWFAQSSFLITSSREIKIVTDPYTPTSDLSAIAEAADIVTVSHEHSDHNNTASVLGSPQIIRVTTQAKGIAFKAIASYHDNTQGKQRGSNTIFAFEVDGLNICHLGDLGHLLDDNQLKAIARVDVLLIPVGGYYTIDAAMASQVVSQLNPKVIIPMHYKTEKMTSTPLATVDDFLKSKSNVIRQDTSVIELDTASLPAEAQIIVLKPSR